MHPAQNKSEIQKLYSIFDASKRLSISINTLRNWDAKGILVPIRTPGGQRRYTEKQLTEFYESRFLQQTNQSTTPKEAEKTYSTEAKNIEVETPNADHNSETIQQFSNNNLPLKKRSLISLLKPALPHITFPSLPQISLSLAHIPHPSFIEFLAKKPFFNIFTAGFTIMFITASIISIDFLPSFLKHKEQSNVLAVKDTNKKTSVLQAKTSQFGLFPRININIPSIFNDTVTLKKGLQVNEISTFSGTLVLQGNVIGESSATFSNLTLSSTSNQLTLGLGTLNWGATAQRTITLPDATTTLVGIDTTQTITNKSISGSSNTLTSIPNSALTNKKITITAGTNLSGGGDVELGDSVSISLASSPIISGILKLADGTAAAPSLTFSDDTDSGLYRLSANSIALITGGTSTQGLTIDSSGNVGIGTTSPLAKLDVRGANNATSPTASISANSNFAALVVDNQGNGDLFAASSSGLNRFVIQEAGNVGVGISTPVNLLEVVQNTTSGSTFRAYRNLTSTSTDSPLVTLHQNNSGDNQPALYLEQNGSGYGIQLYSTSNGSTAFFEQGGTGRALEVVTNTGATGVRPLAEFIVNNAAFIQNAVTITNAGTGNALEIAGTGTRTINSTSGNLTLATTTSGNIILSPIGNVGIGTTSPLAKLDIRGINATSPTASISANSNFAALVVDNTIGDIFTASSSGLNRFVITQNGNIGIGTNVPSKTLDITGTLQVSGAVNLNGAITLGNGTDDVITYTGRVGSIIEPTTGSAYDLGSSTRPWANLYADNITTSGSIDISGTTQADFRINQDNSGNDAESSTLTFERGSPAVNAAFKWNASDASLPNRLFSLNAPLFINPDSGIMYSGTAALLVNQIQEQDIFTASQSGVTKFTLNGLGINPVASISATTSFAGLVVDNTLGDLFTASASGAPRFTITNAGNLVLSNSSATTTFGGIAYTWPTSGQSSGYVLQTDGTGTLSWIDAATSASNFWRQNNGALYPANSTTDLLIGGVSSSSAKFAILNVDSGTPTASVSAGSTGGAYITAAGTLQTTANQTLTLGGDTTGNIILNPLNSTGTLTMKGHTAIGSSATPMTHFNTNISETVTTTTGGTVSEYPGTFAGGMHLATVANPASDPPSISSYLGLQLINDTGSGAVNITSAISSLEGINAQTRNMGSGFVYNVIAITGSAQNNSSGSITDAKGTVGRIANWNASGTITNAYGLYSYVWENNGTIANRYGLYIEDTKTGASSTNNYGGYIAAQTLATNNVGLLIAEATGTKNTNLLIGTTTIPTGSFSIYNSSTDANYFAGNLGIGTTSPLAKLDIRGANATSPAASISANSNFAGLVVDNRGNGDLFTASSSGLARFTIKQNGNVGIGTTNPTAFLDIADSALGGTAFLNIGDDAFLTDVDVANTLGIYGQSDSTGISLRLGSSAADITGKNGNIGISTGIFTGLGATPARKLHISSTTADSQLYLSTVSPSIAFGNNDVIASVTQAAWLGLATNSNVFATGSVAGDIVLNSQTGAIHLATGGTLGSSAGTARITILNGGNVGIGTTAPLATLDVRNNLATTPAASIGANTNFAGLVVDNRGNGDLFTASSSGLNRFVITQNGNVGIGITTPNNALEILSTITPQMRLAYDTSNYYTTAVSNVGAVTFDATGASAGFTFSDTLTANTFSSSGVTITGGTINNTTIGASTPSTGAFTTLTSSGNTTLGTGSSGTHTFGSGAGSTVGIGNSTGALTIASGGTSAWTNTSGDLTISTATSGTLALTSAGVVNLTSGLASGQTTSSAFNFTSSSDLGSADELLQIGDSAATFLTILGNGNLGIGTTSPLATLDVRGNTATTPAASVSANSNFAGLVVDNRGNGDIFTASSSGLERFTIKQNGTVAITSANGVGTTTSSGFVFTDASLTSGTGAYFNSSSITTGKLTQFSTATANTFSSGTLIGIDSSSTALSTGTLLSSSYTGTAAFTGNLNYLDYSPSSAPSTSPTGDLLRLNLGANATNFTGNLFNILDNSSSLFSISKTAVTSSLPTNFTASGDVSIAYDINFTNPTASFIKSQAPLYIAAGETFNSSNLVLQTYNQGTVVVDTATTTGTSMNLLSNSLTTGTGFLVNANALTTGTALSVSSTSTAGGASGNSYLLNLTRSGTNSNATHTAYGISSTVTNTGTTSTNIAGYFSASGATNNYGLIVANGNVGLGTTSPLAGLDIRGTNATSPAASVAANTNFAGLVVDNKGNGDLFTASSSGLNRFVITQAGNVGIGTNTPGTTLDLTGTGRFSSTLTASNGLTLTTGALSLTSTSGSVGLTLTSSTTAFNINSGLFNIDTTNSRVGIGTTAPLLKLDLRDSQAATAAGQIFNTDTGTDADGLVIKLGNTSTTAVANGNHFISFETSGIGIVGSIRGDGATGIDFRTSGIADFAEYLQKEETDNIPFGSLICTTESNKVSICNNQQGTILGVASTHGGFTGGTDLGNKSIRVGLVGVVKTKVTTENGSIKPGDYITVSSIPGIGTKATKAGHIVGKALESFQCDSGFKNQDSGDLESSIINHESTCQDEILVLVQPGWHDPSVFIAQDGSLTMNQEARIMNQEQTSSSSLSSWSGNDHDRISSSDSIASPSASLQNDTNSQLSTLVGRLDLLTSRIDSLQATLIGTNSASLSSWNATDSAMLGSLDSIASLKNDMLGVSSTSATLAQQLALLPEVTIDGTLTVTGRTTLDDLGVTGKLTVGLLSIDGLAPCDTSDAFDTSDTSSCGASLNTLGGNLKLQPLALGGIDILNGKVIIDTKGNVTITQTVTAKTVETEEVKILGAKTIGTSSIPAWKTYVDIQTPVATNSSRIFITATTLTDQPLVIIDKAIGKFRVQIKKAESSPITFDWWIVN